MHGLKSYNLGSTSQSPINSYVLLKDIVSRTKAVVLEVYPITVSTKGLESYLDFISSSGNYDMLIDMAINMWGVRYIQIVSLKPMIDYKNIGYKIKTRAFLKVM